MRLALLRPPLWEESSASCSRAAQITSLTAIVVLPRLDACDDVVSSKFNAHFVSSFLEVSRSLASLRHLTAQRECQLGPHQSRYTSPNSHLLAVLREQNRSLARYKTQHCSALAIFESTARNKRRGVIVPHSQSSATSRDWTSRSNATQARHRESA